MEDEWWRTAVIYQVYPRSFADADGDGTGDLGGILERLGTLRDLGVDALWLSPFFPSPMRDGGYDVADYCGVDRRLGTLDDFDALLEGAHELQLRVIIDLVPNHTSAAHPWFRSALAADPGDAEREHYLFRDGRGSNGDEPPNDWESVFGGPAWTRVAGPPDAGTGTDPGGQWYLHLFDSSQPDLNWESEWVRERFREVLRFWLDRGVDGFRVDVAHGLVKAPGLPDSGCSGAAATTDSMGGGSAPQPYWAQPGVHEIYRDWRRLLDRYPGDRALIAEAWVDPPRRLADWVRQDEMQQAFNFAYLMAPWNAGALQRVIDSSLTAFGAVGAPSTWVLSNHDVIRHATRLALSNVPPQGAGVGPASTGIGEAAMGLRRARAATALMLALPGSAYLYQGEELGLPEAIDLPDDARADPTWFRTGGARYGRDGCRVPLPWEAEAPAYGFSPTGASWLPQPHGWEALSRDTQERTPGSTLRLYRALLAERRRGGLGAGTLEWRTAPGDPGTQNVVAFRNGPVLVVANVGGPAAPLPAGEVLVASDRLQGGELPADTTVWMRATR